MKRFFGYLFVIVGGMLALNLTLYLLTMGDVAFNAASREGSNKAGYIVGTILFFLIMVAIVAGLIRTGLKWIKSTKKVQQSEDVIDAHLINRND